MKAGSTQALFMDIDVDLSLVDSIIFTFSDSLKIKVFQKVYPDDTQVIDGKLYIPLDQRDTLALKGQYYVEGQVNFIDKSVVKTETFQRRMGDTLDTYFIDGNTPNINSADIIRMDIEQGVIFVEGKNGATFVPSVSSDGKLSWTNDRGLDNPDPVNLTGPAGPSGADGVSPSVKVSELEGGHRITITDATGEHSFDVMDGEAGGGGGAIVTRF